jgi:hypothetical protein
MERHGQLQLWVFENLLISTQYSHSTVSHESGRSSKSSSSRRSARRFQKEDAGLLMDPRLTILITDSWEALKSKDDFRDLFGEQSILKMIELEPAARDKMGFVSFRSPRFAELTAVLIDQLDVIVFTLGPDLYEEEFAELGELWREEGIDPVLVAKSVGSSIQDILGEEDFSQEAKEAWDVVFTKVAEKMTTSN